MSRRRATTAPRTQPPSPLCTAWRQPPIASKRSASANARFDCFHVLIAIGELTGTFEHVLEGSVNAIRILSEDNLRQHALSTYEHADLARRARERVRGGCHAGARNDRIRAQTGPRSRRRAWHAATGTTCGNRSPRRPSAATAPPELAENALVASLLRRAEAGQYRESARSTAGSPSSTSILRGASTTRELPNVTTMHAMPSSTPRRSTHGPPSTWRRRTSGTSIFWSGSSTAAASEVCADVVLEPEDNTDRITRRCALLARLVALSAEETAQNRQQPASCSPSTSAPIGLYSVLAALERLYQSPDRTCGDACGRGARTLLLQAHVHDAGARAR